MLSVERTSGHIVTKQGFSSQYMIHLVVCNDWFYSAFMCHLERHATLDTHL